MTESTNPTIQIDWAHLDEVFTSMQTIHDLKKQSLITGLKNLCSMDPEIIAELDTNGCTIN